MVCRKLHNERSGIACEHLCLFQHNTGEDDRRHADEICRNGDPRGSAENRACDHCDERDLCAAGNESRRHDRHAAITFVFNGTRRHNARNAAACADQHRDEGFTGKTEPTEDTVEHERDTRHVAACFKERKHQEQNEHLGHEAEHGADAGNDTVLNETVQPFRNAEVSFTVQKHHVNQRRNAGDPYAVIGGIGLVKAFLLEIADRILERHCVDFLISVFGYFVKVYGDVVQRERFLVLHLYDCRFLIGRKSLELCNRCCRVERFVLGVDLEPVGFKCSRSGGVIIRGFLGGAAADAEKMPSVAEQTVVCPVGRRRADAHHSYPVDDEHNKREDRQTQPAVGDDTVDLVGHGQLACVLLFITGLDDRTDINVTLVCDDAFRVVVQFLLRRLDVLLNMCLRCFRDIELFHHLAVAFKDLDRVPALLFFRKSVHDRFFDMRKRMFNRTGERMLRNGFRALRRFNRLFGGFRDADSLQCGDLDDPTADLLGKALRVDLITVLFHDVHHVDGDDHRDAELNKLRRQIQVALKVRSVDDVQDCVRAFVDQIVSCNNFLQRVRRKRIDTGKVRDDHVAVILQLAFLLFHGDTRPVAHKLVGAGQRVEQGCFAAVRVAREGNANTHKFLLCR